LHHICKVRFEKDENVNQNKLKVFLSETSKDVTSQRTFLYNVLQKAELEVISLDENEKSDLQFLKQKVLAAIGKSDCSIHIIGNHPKNINSSATVTELQLIEATNYSKDQKSEYRIFIWQPLNSGEKISEDSQEQFITSIRNSILQNITISNHESPVSFVEDIYSIMNSQPSSLSKGTETEIFFIYNESDDDFAKEIVDLLNDVLKVETLSMIQNSERDYTDLIIEQTKQSKLIVVYFNRSTNWAKPFVQQLWRLIGGASSTIPIIVAADISLRTQFQNSFEMPNVSSFFVSEELIPLEIKVQYDRITNQ
jgi:hypothetical protein